MAFDESRQIRHLSFPHVGGEDHTQGYPFRFGVWADGELAWLRRAAEALSPAVR